MRSEVTTKKVMALKTAQIKVNPDDGSLSHLLSLECVLEPGDLERIAIMFKQRLPIDLTLTSPQSRMDLMVEVRREEEPQHVGPLDPTTLEELRENAKVAIRSAVAAEQKYVDSGDLADQELANAAGDAATNAVSKAADAQGKVVTDLLTDLESEVQHEILDEGERQADDAAAEEGAAAFAVDEAANAADAERIGADQAFEESQAPAGDPEALQRKIAGHAAESEAAAGGDGTGNDTTIPEKPKRQRKARQAT